jgi:subtilase family serine protease
MRSLEVPVLNHCLRSLQFLAVTVVLTLGIISAASAEPRPTLTTHIPDAVATGQAVRVGDLPPTQRLALAISLPLRNQSELDVLLQQLYDPDNPLFRQYLTVEEFAERFGPSWTDHDALINFAKGRNLTVTKTRPNRLVIDLEAAVSDIEEAFHIRIGIYQHPTENRTFYAPDREPTLDLDIPVLHISGLDDFSLPVPKNRRSTNVRPPATGSAPGGLFAGRDMRAAYYGSGPLTGAGQSLGLALLAGYDSSGVTFGGYEISDIQLYFKTLQQSWNVLIIGVSLNGAPLDCPYPQCDDSEAALDIEMAISMAPGLSQLVAYVGSLDVSIFAQMAADNTSKQLSCSFGWGDDEGSLDPIFEEMKAQGQTLLVATGDKGSNTPADRTWPSDDPWVEAVGGTVLVTTGPGGAWKSETGWADSAGMPSKNGIPIPSYQKLKGVINGSNHGSKTLRNIPDIAANATNYYACANTSCKGVGAGTSYAAPLWAGLIALANQQAAANHVPTVGFLNPVLYDIGISSVYNTDFHDIVSGSNGTYPAVKGYDLVTGWGSPVGPELIDDLAKY